MPCRDLHCSHPLTTILKVIDSPRPLLPLQASDLLIIMAIIEVTSGIAKSWPETSPYLISILTPTISHALNVS